MQSSLGERITPGMTTAIVGVTGMPNFTTPTLSSPPSFLSPMPSQDQSRGQHPQSSEITRPTLLAPTPIRYKVIHYPSRTSRQGHGGGGGGGGESSQYVSLPHVQTMTNPHNNNHHPLGYSTNVSLNEGINRSLSTGSNPAARECSSTAVPVAEKVRRSLMFENANGTEIVAESGVVGKENVHNIISQTTSNLVSPSGKETGHNSAPPQPFSLHQLASQSSREDYGQVLPGINSFDNHSATAQNENGSTQSLTSNVISPTTINKNLASAIHPTSNNATKSTDCLNKIIKKTAQEVESQDEEDFKQSELKFTSSFRKPIPLASTNFNDMSLEGIARPTHTLASSQKLFSTTNNKLSPSRNFGSSANLLKDGNRSPRTQTYHAGGNKAMLTNNRRKSLGTHSPSSSSTIMKIELSKPPTVIVNERRSPSRIGSPRSFVGSFLKQKISPAPKSVGVYPPTPSTVPPTGQGIINPQVRSVKVVANPHIRPVTGIDHRPFVTDNSWCPLSCQSPIHSICGGSPRSMTPHHIAGTPSSTRSSREKENAVMKEDPMTTLSPASAARRQQEFLETYANQKEDEMGSPQEALSTQQPSRVQFGDNEDENDIEQVATVGATTASEGACSSPTSDGLTPNHQRREGLFGRLVESSTSTPARKNSNLGTQNVFSSHGVFGTGVDITQPQTKEKEENEDFDDSHPLAVFQKLNSNASSSHANITKSNFSRFALASNSTSAYHSRGDADVFLNLSREADDENDGANDSQITGSRMVPKSSATSSRQRLSGDDSAPSANLLPTLGMNGSAGNNSSSRHPTSTSSGTTTSTQMFQSTVLQHSADGVSNLLHAQHNGAPNNNSSYNIHAAQVPVLPRLHESSCDTHTNNNTRRLSFTDLPHPKDRTDTSSPSPNSKFSKGPVGIKPLDANLFAENPSRNAREEHSAFSVPASRLPPRSVQHSGGGRHSVILFDDAEGKLVPTRSGAASYSRNDPISTTPVEIYPHPYPTPSYRRVQSVVLSGVGGKRIGGTIGEPLLRHDNLQSSRRKSYSEQASSIIGQRKASTVELEKSHHLGDGGGYDDESSDDDEWFVAAQTSQGPQLTAADVAQAMGCTEEEVVQQASCDPSIVLGAVDAFGQSVYGDNNNSLSTNFGTPQQPHHPLSDKNEKSYYSAASPRPISQSPHRHSIHMIGSDSVGMADINTFGFQHRPPPSHVLVVSPQRLYASHLDTSQHAALHPSNSLIGHGGREGAIAPMPSFSPRRPTTT